MTNTLNRTEGVTLKLSNLGLQILSNFVSVFNKTPEKGESSSALFQVVGNEAFSPTTTFDHACSAFALSFAFVPVFFSLSFSLSLSSRGARDSFFF
jgi:hypothetical protein